MEGVKIKKGTRLLRLLKSKNISQSKLALDCGVRVTTINRLCKKENTTCRKDLQEKICVILECGLDDAFGTKNLDKFAYGDE